MLSFSEFKTLFDKQDNLQYLDCNYKRFGPDFDQISWVGASHNKMLFSLMWATLDGHSIEFPENFQKYWPSIGWKYPEMKAELPSLPWEDKCCACFDKVKARQSVRCVSCPKQICSECLRNAVSQGYSVERCVMCGDQLMFRDLKNLAWFRRENRYQTDPDFVQREGKGRADFQNAWTKYGLCFVMCCDKPVPPLMTQQDGGEKMIYKCGECAQRFCFECLQPLANNHSCDDADLEVAKVIKQTTKPCPKCGVLIQKSEGCDHMFCVQCKVGFCWRTGTILKTSTNPLHQQYLLSMDGDYDLPIFSHVGFESRSSRILVMETIRQMKTRVLTTIRQMRAFATGIRTRNTYQYIRHWQVNVRIATLRFDVFLRELVYLVYLVPLAPLWYQFVQVFASCIPCYPEPKSMLEEHYFYYFICEVVYPLCKKIWLQHFVGLKNVCVELKKRAFCLGLTQRNVTMFLRHHSLSELESRMAMEDLTVGLEKAMVYLRRINDQKDNNEQCSYCSICPVASMSAYDLCSLTKIKRHNCRSACLLEMHEKILQLKVSQWEIAIDPPDVHFDNIRCFFYGGPQTPWSDDPKNDKQGLEDNEFSNFLNGVFYNFKFVGS